MANMSTIIDVESNNNEYGISMTKMKSQQYNYVDQACADEHKAEPSYKVSQKGITLEWSNLSYSIKTVKKEERQLLKNVSGIASPGQILSILGSSGAGKSTLLDALAGRLNENLQGSVLVNGQAMNHATFRKETSAYVMQSDNLFPMFTVRETFRYAALLRIADKSHDEKLAMAEDCLKMLGLESCANTLVGNTDIRGISGGEMRRVTIGVDIVHKPRVIFLDEPTSGLDSQTAFTVMNVLRDLTRKEGCTVILTIHQPSARIFDLIDYSIFLASGQITYFGRASDLHAFAESICIEAGLEAPSYANPPELFLELSHQLLEQDKITLLTSRCLKSNAVVDISRSQLESSNKQSAKYANSIWREVMILTERGFLNIYRTPELFFARLTVCCVLSIIISTMFLDSRNTDQGIRNKGSWFILSLAYFLWDSLENCPLFFSEIFIVERETSGGAYRAISHLLSSTIVQFPFQIILAFVYSAIGWWTVGFPNVGERFLFQVLVLFIILNTGFNFAIMMCSVLPNAMAANTTTSSILFIMLFFSGYFLSRDDIPDYWIFLHYLSLFKYGVDSEIVNGFLGYAETDSKTNKQILKEYGVEDVNKWTGLGVLLAFIVFFRVVFYYTFTTKYNGKRKS